MFLKMFSTVNKNMLASYTHVHSCLVRNLGSGGEHTVGGISLSPPPPPPPSVYNPGMDCNIYMYMYKHSKENDNYIVIYNFRSLHSILQVF